MALWVVEAIILAQFTIYIYTCMGIFPASCVNIFLVTATKIGLTKCQDKHNFELIYFFLAGRHKLYPVATYMILCWLVIKSFLHLRTCLSYIFQIWFVCETKSKTLTQNPLSSFVCPNHQEVQCTPPRSKTLTTNLSVLPLRELYT